MKYEKSLSQTLNHVSPINVTQKFSLPYDLLDYIFPQIVQVC